MVVAHPSGPEVRGPLQQTAPPDVASLVGIFDALEACGTSTSEVFPVVLHAIFTATELAIATKVGVASCLQRKAAFRATARCSACTSEESGAAFPDATRPAGYRSIGVWEHIRFARGLDRLELFGPEVFEAFRAALCVHEDVEKGDAVQRRNERPAQAAEVVSPSELLAGPRGATRSGSSGPPEISGRAVGQAAADDTRGSFVAGDIDAELLPGVMPRHSVGRNVVADTETANTAPSNTTGCQSMAMEDQSIVGAAADEVLDEVTIGDIDELELVLCAAGDALEMVTAQSRAARRDASGTKDPTQAERRGSSSERRGSSSDRRGSFSQLWSTVAVVEGQSGQSGRRRSSSGAGGQNGGQTFGATASLTTLHSSIEEAADYAIAKVASAAGAFRRTSSSLGTSPSLGQKMSTEDATLAYLKAAALSENGYVPMVIRSVQPAVDVSGRPVFNTRYGRRVLMSRFGLEAAIVLVVICYVVSVILKVTEYPCHENPADMRLKLVMTCAMALAGQHFYFLALHAAPRPLLRRVLCTFDTWVVLACGVRFSLAYGGLLVRIARFRCEDKLTSFATFEEAYPFYDLTVVISAVFLYFSGFFVSVVVLEVMQLSWRKRALAWMFLILAALHRMYVWAERALSVDPVVDAVYFEELDTAFWFQKLKPIDHLMAALSLALVFMLKAAYWTVIRRADFAFVRGRYEIVI